VAIVTRDEVKTYLQITTTDYDTLIDELIPQAEGLFLLVRGIPFFTFDGDITDTSAEITNIADADFTNLYISQIIEYRGSTTNTFRATNLVIDPDNNKVITDTAATFTLEEAEITIYPLGSQLVASKIIGYFLIKTNAKSLKSENIGTYSYTKFDMKSGLPTDITGMIEKYQRGYC